MNGILPEPDLQAEAAADSKKNIVYISKQGQSMQPLLDDRVLMGIHAISSFSESQAREGKPLSSWFGLLWVHDLLNTKTAAVEVLPGLVMHSKESSFVTFADQEKWLEEC